MPQEAEPAGGASAAAESARGGRQRPATAEAEVAAHLYRTEGGATELFQHLYFDLVGVGEVVAVALLQS